MRWRFSMRWSSPIPKHSLKLRGWPRLRLMGLNFDLAINWLMARVRENCSPTPKLIQTPNYSLTLRRFHWPMARARASRLPMETGKPSRLLRRRAIRWHCCWLMARVTPTHSQ